MRPGTLRAPRVRVGIDGIDTGTSVLLTAALAWPGSDQPAARTT